MSHHIEGPWGLRVVHLDHKLRAVILETKAPNQPCNDPAIFALREDWMSIVDLPDTNPRKASLNLMLKAPDMASILQRLAEKTRQINAVQHSGGKVAAEDWAELHQLTNEAFALLHGAGHDRPSVGSTPGTSARAPDKPAKTLWLAFATDDGQIIEESLHASEAQAGEALLKTFQERADRAGVPSLTEAIAAPEDCADGVDLDYYRNQTPAWHGHMEWLQTEQNLSIDAWVIEVELPEGINV